MAIVLDSPHDVFNCVGARDFRRAVTELCQRSEYHRHNLSLRSSYDGFECWLGPRAAFGFAISPDSELINVFSTETGGGRRAMDFAIARYSELHLNCFAGPLERFYGQFGFREERREPSWYPDGSDVVYMRRGPLIVPA